MYSKQKIKPNTTMSIKKMVFIEIWPVGVRRLLFGDGASRLF